MTIWKIPWKTRRFFKKPATWNKSYGDWFSGLFHLYKSAFLELWNRVSHSLQKTLKNIVVLFFRLERKSDVKKFVFSNMCIHFFHIHFHKEKYLGELIENPDFILEYHSGSNRKSIGFHSFPVCRNISVEVLLSEWSTIDFMDIYTISRDISNYLIAHFWRTAICKSVRNVFFSTNNEFWNISIILWLYNFLWSLYLFLEFLNLMKLWTTVFKDTSRYRRRFARKVSHLNEDIFPALYIERFSIDNLEKRKVFIECFIKMF